MGQRTIGIDLAIRGDHVARIFDDGRPQAKSIRFRLTSDSLAGLVAKFREGLPAGSTITAVMEPTGMSWFPVARWLEQAGIKAIRVKGQRVRALRRYLSEHTKTDAADAYVLGAIPLFGGVPVDPVYVPNADRHALQRLTRQRERLEEEVTTIKRRLIDLVRWASPAIEAVLPDFRTNLALAILHDMFNPADVIKARRTTLLGFVAKHANGNHPHTGPFADKLVDGLKAAALETQRLHGAAVNFELLQLEVAVEIDRMRLLESQLGKLGREIETLYGKLHPSDALRTIPGIGNALAPLVLGVLHEARRFAGLHQLRGFCGLFPRTNSSGGADQPGQSITQSGNNRIKRALYLAADAARRIDPGLAEVYWRLMVRKGHHHKQALCAVATRIVNRIGKVLRTGEAYELRDQAGKPISVAEGRAIVAEQFSIPAEIRNARRKHRAESLA
ncbi:IS110 family transposase [Acidisphaera sp. L21]|uniref:IS110 family transposase n=1 Tax=Acidisphaera sp. L21 TaxID=1641851 RepID=UPI00131B6C85|nr:IS110 family transposase [Acidisphaera sp. L21]